MMTIQLCLAAGNQVKVTVRDNGLGIPGENLTKIFNHGFTTKKDGHGFGLHSGANAAKEMGGSLMGHSAGPGQGAEFTLLLPTSCTDRIQKQTPIQKNV
jgi:C4-dicarboxylate-specific signal transduction histidine kinase